MGKRIYWIAVILVALAGLTVMIYYGIQPQPIQKIKLSKFETHTVLANSLLLRLREEIKNSPVMFLGLDPDRPEHFEIWREFLKQNQEPGMAYDLIVMDQDLTTDLFPEAQRVGTRDENFPIFFEGITKAVTQGHRVAVLMPLIYSVQMIPQNVASHFNSQPNLLVPATSFSLTDFPRSREQEKDMSQRCIVEGVDQTGLGPYGCLLVQMARANYRKRYEPGDAVGLVNQIGLRDYLILYTKEK
jgi:hypothetical protein